MLKTSEEWYQADESGNIVDPDGWNRKNPDIAVYWHCVPISAKEYLARLRRSSIVAYDKQSHTSPFGQESSKVLRLGKAAFCTMPHDHCAVCQVALRSTESCAKVCDGCTDVDVGSELSLVRQRRRLTPSPSCCYEAGDSEMLNRFARLEESWQDLEKESESSKELPTTP